jgi:hypothetical protein
MQKANLSPKTTVPELAARVGTAVLAKLAASPDADIIVAREGRGLLIYDSDGQTDPLTIS